MNERLHALFARQLIALCGGLDEATRACRLGRSRLAECRIAGAGVYLPADVIADLEAYCGQPVYSRALMEARPSSIDTEGVLDEACTAVELAAQLLSLVRKAALEDRLSPAEHQAIEAAVVKLREAADAVGAAAERRAP